MINKAILQLVGTIYYLCIDIDPIISSYALIP